MYRNRVYVISHEIKYYQLNNNIFKPGSITTVLYQ